MGITFIFLLPLLLLGLVLFVRGVRGRRVDDHPLCRKCGFDLTGKPADSTRCSECGADVSAVHGIRIGHRQRRKAPLVVGSILLLMSLTALSPVIISRFVTVNWQALKPAWMLNHELKNSTTTTAARTELMRRLADGSLSDAQLQRFVDYALHMQLTQPVWDRAWGNVVEQAHSLKRISPQKWMQYLEQAVIATLELRPKVRKGDDLNPQISVASRLGSTAVLVVRREAREDEIWIGGSKVAPPRGGSSENTFRGTGSSYSSSWWNWEAGRKALMNLPEGPTEYRVKASMRLYESEDKAATPVTTIVKEFVATFDLRAESEPAVVLIEDDPVLHTQMEKCFRVESVRYTSGRLGVMINVGSTPLPVAASFNAVVHADGKEWKTSSAAFRQGATNTGWHVTTSVPAEFPKQLTRCDVHLQPNAAHVASHPSITSIWNGKIVFKNVPLERASE